MCVEFKCFPFLRLSKCICARVVVLLFVSSSNSFISLDDGKEIKKIRIRVFGWVCVSDMHNIYCEGHNRTNAHLYEICYALGAINQRINRACQPIRHSTHSITSKSHVIIRAEQQNEMK